MRGGCLAQLGFLASHEGRMADCSRAVDDAGDNAATIDNPTNRQDPYIQGIGIGEVLPTGGWRRHCRRSRFG